MQALADAKEGSALRPRWPSVLVPQSPTDLVEHPVGHSRWGERPRRYVSVRSSATACTSLCRWNRPRLTGPVTSSGVIGSWTETGTRASPSSYRTSSVRLAINI